jgi:small-conductance mechanosensitive channel
MSDALGRLNRILKEKQGVLEDLIDRLGTLIIQFETIRASASDLDAKIDAKIRGRQAEGLFDRKQIVHKLFEKGALKEEIVSLGTGLRKPFNKDVLIAEGHRFRETAAVSLLILVFLSTMAVVFYFKVRRFCLEYEKKHTVIGVITIGCSSLNLGRNIITKKIFAESDLEPGLQASITTISIYVMWGLGVILALSVLGVNTTALAVVFGALGIGLGFGLQAIFNNFISGIILLFERPIQVGDDVEINGTWATIKQINVRATIVQTYDNASLIIPNSEFVSSVVKNWTFGDKRLRRDIDVGVA